ncbi:sulfurtransferase-like selenium metabolism protein YedF [Megalodesulfovibrio gigas]|uniref:Putative selenium metabolism protein YedF n=1 Tax=Megalodesulfovibrio gigas (strain ATCC 19364 / DSM 1382 / NCIMB 9332 / VKM B-1759) TaxID=1121448 RepID=T2GD22_MEGG1|nr:sulfurtransferase-like selenium metabolism protein YedF [Megalodesulfovibrio gigas]AGW14026.1 putative selenium metabolism protein YedF [Megalodesulfovibrio gigas DSM 1382 = ATCC 19364]
MNQPDFVSVDCRGLACPQPVLQCKTLLKSQQPARLEVLVDNDAARENVIRFLQHQGYAVKQTLADGIWTLHGARADAQAAAGDATTADCPECRIMSDQELAALSQRILVFIPAATMGHGDDELGGRLLLNFLKTLPELGGDLWRIILVNAGVQLATAEHPALEPLQALERAGVSILVCGTCLEHFGLMAAKAVGQTTNMLDVVTSMQLATKIIRT